MVILSDHIDSGSDPIYDRYDVFLSFRGSDTRNGFTDHLYHKLIDAAIPTFRDDDELEKGEALKQQLEKAIRESSVSIIVFSQNYASSGWCLDEVVMILEQNKLRRNHTVLPIFYKVDASDVRYQNGSYGEAFNQHQQKGRVSLEKMKVWKAALTEAANLVGLPFNNAGPETEFIHKCLSTVLRNLPKYKALDVPEFLVAMDDHIRTNGIASWFEDRSKDNNVLLICGIGGLGKTTIAKHFFNKYFWDFDDRYFLARITAGWDEVGVCGLQSRLLSNILNKREEIRIYNCDEGTQMIKRVLCNKKVLLVLDDVSETEQLDALLGQTQRFCPGSKILVTTRNMSLKKDFIIHPNVKNITGLCHEESLELFSWHAFRQRHPPEEYLQISRDILLRCEGLPLALIVLGSSLRKTLDIFFWKKQLQKWDEIANPSIQKVMQVSFDSLEDETLKNLFLDVACFFVGEEEDYVVRILDHCGLHATVGIQSLIDRCLITTTYDKKLMMHQVILDMGREIVRQECPNEPERRSRLWHHEHSFTVLKYDKGTEAIQGLILDGQKINKLVSDGSGFAPADANSHLITKVLGYAKKKTEEVLDRFLPSKEGELKMDAFSKMINLKLVNLNHVYLTGSCNKFPEKLRWISWHGCPQEYVPMEFPLENLVALDLQHSLLKVVWKGLKEVKSLKFLNLNFSLELRQTPDFTGLPQLERLTLRGCSNLVKVCKTIGMLNGLVLLDLADCKSVTDLPDLPESIVTLDLSGCSHLGQSTREQKIFSWTRIVNFASPNIFMRPIKLLPRLPLHIVQLNLKGCNLTDESFPSSFSQLSSLEKLNLSGNLIIGLPDCIRSLSNSRFRELHISDCPQLQSVIHPPSTLENLILDRNTQLQETIVSSMKEFGRLSLSIDKRTDYVEIEGCFKGVQARNVERKVIKNLGLESVPIGCVGKVQYEHGIFSTFVENRARVSSCFTTYFPTYKHVPEGYWFEVRESSKIGYSIPCSSVGNKKIQGLNICLPLKDHVGYLTKIDVTVGHKTKDLVWTYNFQYYGTGSRNLWVSTWKCVDDVFKVGDQLEISIKVEGEKPIGTECVVEVGIRTVYEEEDEDFEDDETTGDKEDEDFEDNETTGDEEDEDFEDDETTGDNRLLWTDQMYDSFSDIRTPGTTSYFSFTSRRRTSGGYLSTHVSLSPYT